MNVYRQHDALFAISVIDKIWSLNKVNNIDFNKTLFVAFIALKLEIISFCRFNMLFFNIQSFDGMMEMVCSLILIFAFCLSDVNR